MRPSVVMELKSYVCYVFTLMEKKKSRRRSDCQIWEGKERRRMRLRCVRTRFLMNKGKRATRQGKRPCEAEVAHDATVSRMKPDFHSEMDTVPLVSRRNKPRCVCEEPRRERGSTR